MDSAKFVELLKLISEAGWVFAVPELEAEDEVPGLIIGTADYVESILDHLPDSPLIATPPKVH